MSMLNKDEIQKALQNQEIEIHVFDCIDSTNQFLSDYTPTHPVTLCLAEQQTHGRGRLDRTWYSPVGNLYFSCLYPIKRKTQTLSGLSLVVGLTIYKTLQQFGIHQSLGLKWPNDVLYQNKKIAGVLIVSQLKNNGAMVIVGIGINVNMLQDEGVINQAWTSMRAILNKTINCNELCVVLTHQLLQGLKLFDQEGLLPFIDEWNSANYLRGQTIKLQKEDSLIKGNLLGINIHGQLLLELADGSVHAYSSGEVRIVKE